MNQYIFLKLQRKQWLMARCTKETLGTRQGSTALLLVRTVEICSGRHSLMEEQNINSLEYSQLEKLTFSICSKLASRFRAQVCTGFDHPEITDGSFFF